MLALCSTSVDWSATGTWVTGMLTALAAFFALSTWKSQLKLQDRYYKVDLLLESFVLCVRAAHHWQWNAAINEKNQRSIVLEEMEGFPEWKESLMSYRLAWYKAQHLVKKDAWFSPDRLQSKVITFGVGLRKNQNLESDAQSFLDLDAEFTDLLHKGLSEISALRNFK
jgi:hypothetical protein